MDNVVAASRSQHPLMVVLLVLIAMVTGASFACSIWLFVHWPHPASSIEPSFRGVELDHPMRELAAKTKGLRCSNLSEATGLRTCSVDGQSYAGVDLLQPAILTFDRYDRLKSFEVRIKERDDFASLIQAFDEHYGDVPSQVISGDKSLSKVWQFDRGMKCVAVALEAGAGVMCGTTLQQDSPGPSGPRMKGDPADL